MKRFLTFQNVVFGGAILLSFFLIILALGWYPIASVNGDLISARHFRQYVDSALSYQATSFSTYSASSTRLLAASQQSEAQLGSVALDELIEHQLIFQGVEEKIQDSHVQLTKDKVANYREQPELIGASRDLFRISPELFSNVLLEPEARRELLRGRLFLDGVVLDEWLIEKRKSAKVRIFSPTYIWQEFQVLVKP